MILNIRGWKFWRVFQLFPMRQVIGYCGLRRNGTDFKGVTIPITRCNHTTELIRRDVTGVVR